MKAGTKTNNNTESWLFTFENKNKNIYVYTHTHTHTYTHTNTYNKNYNVVSWTLKQYMERYFPEQMQLTQTILEWVTYSMAGRKISILLESKRSHPMLKTRAISGPEEIDEMSNDYSLQPLKIQNQSYRPSIFLTMSKSCEIALKY